MALAIEQAETGWVIWMRWRFTLADDGLGQFGVCAIGMLVGIFIIAGFVVLVAWAVRAVSCPLKSGISRRSAALDRLEERHARDEIGREEYLQRENDVLAR